MIVSIHQPAYLPWMGYFDKIAKADVFVFLDTVQFQKSSFQNRNKILTPTGPLWLTIPVQTKGKLFDTMLKDIEIDTRQNWATKHLKTIEANYRKAPNFRPTFELLKGYYDGQYHLLSALCFDMMIAVNKVLGIQTKIIKASEMESISSHKSDLVLDLCKNLNATEYLSGSMGRDYLNMEAFERENIKVTFQDYKHPTYAQGTEPFTPNMGIVDLLMHEDNAASFFK